MMKLMACILVLGTSLAAVAQEPATGVIVGSVLDASGAALPGVTVTAGSPGGTIAATTVTDSTGSYTLSLPSGTYLVRTTLPGYRESVATATVAGASRIDVPFTVQVAPPLEQSPEIPPPPFGRGRVDIRADSQTREDNVIRYRGNVRMRTEGSEVTADEIDFNVDTRTADVRGNVQVRILAPEYRVIPLTKR
jgi:hypothetical protein